MFEISQLNEKKLSELQEIAKKLNVPKYRSLKKSDLVYQILGTEAVQNRIEFIPMLCQSVICLLI